MLGAACSVDQSWREQGLVHDQDQLRGSGWRRPSALSRALFGSVCAAGTVGFKEHNGCSIAWAVHNLVAVTYGRTACWRHVAPFEQTGLVTVGLRGRRVLFPQHQPHVCTTMATSDLAMPPDVRAGPRGLIGVSLMLAVHLLGRSVVSCVLEHPPADAS